METKQSEPWYLPHSLDLSMSPVFLLSPQQSTWASGLRSDPAPLLSDFPSSHLSKDDFFSPPWRGNMSSDRWTENVGIWKGVVTSFCHQNSRKHTPNVIIDMLGCISCFKAFRSPRLPCEATGTELCGSLWLRSWVWRQVSVLRALPFWCGHVGCVSVQLLYPLSKKKKQKKLILQLSVAWKSLSTWKTSPGLNHGSLCTARSFSRRPQEQHVNSNCSKPWNHGVSQYPWADSHLPTLC